MDVVMEDIQNSGVTEEDTRNRVKRRQIICCGDL